ncbi:bacteriocin [Desulfovibrio aerotolerans]|uniref:Bacteriocin n=1 Tax=Solidesulfovibrio aerotolerans TaxID=295255 RepID=A0A7C9JB21_9BACT|nr:family 1 encapsulin nanocompartment shell protein [Solidesulfovibrio aerotolerans]MYL84758.1 bacteriocin [Solidesulfovibrio aerotolerans]
MDILKRDLAPITAAAWQAVDNRARQTLTTMLSARRVMDVTGPLGWEFAAVPLGRIEYAKTQSVSGITYGLHQVKPLVEVKVAFTLDIAEIDNAARGGKDLDLAGLDAAAEKLARFEEEALYHGFAPAGIRGLSEVSSQSRMQVSGDPEDIADKVSKALTALRKTSVEGPYALVVGPEMWVALSGHVRGYPLSQYLETMLAGQVIVSPFIEEAYVVSTRGGDLEMTLGGDIAIGYASHDTEKVALFFLESFTFQVLDPTVVVRLDYTAG